jgi:hypothetical protein
MQSKLPQGQHRSETARIELLAESEMRKLISRVVDSLTAHVLTYASTSSAASSAKTELALSSTEILNG